MLQQFVKNLCEKGKKDVEALDGSKVDESIKASSEDTCKCIQVLKKAKDCYNFMKFLKE